MTEYREVPRLKKITASAVMKNSIPENFLNGAKEHFEAVFVNSGKLKVTYADKTFICTAGTGAVFAPGEIHFVGLVPDTDTEYMFAAAETDSTDPQGYNSTAAELNIFQKQLLLSMSGTIENICEYNVILSEFSKADYNAAAILSLKLELLIMEVEANSKKIPPVQSRDALLFGEAVKEMETCVNGRLSIGDLADKLEISLSHLKRIFALFTNSGVHEYFMEIKIKEAKKLLKSGVSVTKTAEITGFNNQNYFSAAFKRISGISPKEYSVRRNVNHDKPAVRTKNRETPAVSKKTDMREMPSYLL